MFKGGREDKQILSVEDKTHPIPDVITGTSGQVWRRADYEDPHNPGRTVPGRLYSSFELQLCGRWGLVSPSGFSFAAHLPLPLKPDPAYVNIAEAPEHLRRAVAEAQVALEAHRAKIRECQDRIRAAEVKAWMATVSRGNDPAAHKAALSAGMAAAEELRALIAEEPPFVKRLADAERRLKFWQDDERMYETGVVARLEPAGSVF